MVHPMTLWHGGRVDTDVVEFHATGDGADAAYFLNAIAAAIVSFPAISEQDLKIEKLIVEAENPAAFGRVSSGLPTYRFGMSGPGAGHFGAPSTSGLSRAEVIDWARRWLTAENAAVTFNGVLPDSLDIRLSQGGRIVREHHEPLTMAPTVIRSAKDGVALSLIVPTGGTAHLNASGIA